MLRDTAPLMSCAKDQDTWRVRFQQVFFALTTVYSQESSISQPHVKYVSTLLPPHNLLLCFPTICVNLVWKGVNWILNIEAGIHIECWLGQDEKWIDPNRLAWRSREVGSRRTTSSDPIHTDHRRRNYVLDRPTPYVIICAQSSVPWLPYTIHDASRTCVCPWCIYIDYGTPELWLLKSGKRKRKGKTVGRT